MDELDRAIVNRLQDGFPVVARPFAAAARELGTDEDELIGRLAKLLAAGVLTRFGPMYQVEQLGGAFSLAALRVTGADFERVAGIVNAMPEVAHNYERAHEFNLWFVLATETPEGIGAALAKIERATGYRVYHFPKEREYFVGLRLAA